MSTELDSVRARVRAFLDETLDSIDDNDNDNGFSPSFSRKCGEAGLIGMTWPRKYGGHERTHLERFIVSEELLAARAPVRAHWVADRQSGAMLLEYACDEIRAAILPRIAKGECCFCIGLSEANSGSDLFSVTTKAKKAGDGWVINGHKLWTSLAHKAHYMIALLRTSPPSADDRRYGLTQFLVPMDADGVTVRPILNMVGDHDFNEVILDEVFVHDTHVLGEVDAAARQATRELIYERSGPDRYLETLPVLLHLIDLAQEDPDDRLAEGIGRLVAQLLALRQMSFSVATMLEDNKLPDTEAAMIKDLGTCWEQDLPAQARLLSQYSKSAERLPIEAVIQRYMLLAPKLTIQGGTSEVLRGIIARGLGLR